MHEVGKVKPLYVLERCQNGKMKARCMIRIGCMYVGQRRWHITRNRMIDIISGRLRMSRQMLCADEESRHRH